MTSSLCENMAQVLFCQLELSGTRFNSFAQLPKQAGAFPKSLTDI